jgi:hypothetical protein
VREREREREREAETETESRKETKCFFLLGIHSRDNN